MRQRSNIRWFYPKSYASKLLVVFQQLCRPPDVDAVAREPAEPHIAAGIEAGQYNAHDDVAKSFEEAYRVIRERMAKGGPGWTPKP